MSSVFRQLKVLLFVLGASIVLISQFGGSNLYRGNVIIQPYESMEWKIFLIRGTKVNLFHMSRHGMSSLRIGLM